MMPGAHEVKFQYPVLMMIAGLSFFLFIALQLLTLLVMGIRFLPEAKPTGLVEAMSVRPSRLSVAFSHFGGQA